MDEKKKQRGKRDGTRNTGRLSLAPLGFEEALGALLQTGPHPREVEADEQAEQEADKERGR